MSNHSFLASDDANPEFVGANNPDQRLNAEFKTVAVQNNFRSEQEGRPIFDDVLMVRIQVPGDVLSIIEAPVREDHKRRFPLQWAHFSNKMNGDQRLAGKTPISQWPRLTPGQVAELQHMQFLSVEDVANASDGSLTRMGMVGGMSPYSFRDAAQRFLKLAAGDASETKHAAQIAEQKAENDQLRADMSAMQKQMEERFAQMAATAPVQVEALAAAPDALANLAKANSSTKQPRG